MKIRGLTAREISTLKYIAKTCKEKSFYLQAQYKENASVPVNIVEMWIKTFEMSNLAKEVVLKLCDDERNHVECESVDSEDVEAVIKILYDSLDEK